VADGTQGPSWREGSRWRRGQHHYGFVLVLILVSLVFQLAAPEADWARLLGLGLQGVALLAALRASRMNPIVLRLAAAVVLAAVVAAAGALIGFGVLGATASRSLAVLLVALAPVAIARGTILDFREQGAVSLHTMFGVLCIYLLIGSLFAFIDGVVDSVGSTQFFAQTAHASVSDVLYFSFATITTVGYGDLTAATDVARSLAIAEALTGQIYLVTVVAVIVGGLSRRPA
jgi:Ion channel